MVHLLVKSILIRG